MVWIIEIKNIVDPAIKDTGKSREQSLVEFNDSFSVMKLEERLKEMDESALIYITFAQGEVPISSIKDISLNPLLAIRFLRDKFKDIHGDDVQCAYAVFYDDRTHIYSYDVLLTNKIDPLNSRSARIYYLKKKSFYEQLKSSRIYNNFQRFFSIRH